MEPKGRVDFMSFVLGGIVVPIVLGLTVYFTACRKHLGFRGPRAVAYQCPGTATNRTVNVFKAVKPGVPVPYPGVVQESLVVCPGDTVTWERTGDKKDFKVTFASDPTGNPISPFSDQKAEFEADENGHAVSQGVVDPQQIKAYHYTIIVDGKTYDPHIINMGGP